jgi:hypothetical protein
MLMYYVFGLSLRGRGGFVRIYVVIVLVRELGYFEYYSLCMFLAPRKYLLDCRRCSPLDPGGLFLYDL